VSFLGDVLIGFGLVFGGALLGAHIALAATKPGRLCACGHYEADHVDGACDASQYCDCSVFVYVLDARKFATRGFLGTLAVTMSGPLPDPDPANRVSSKDWANPPMPLDFTEDES